MSPEQEKKRDEELKIRRCYGDGTGEGRVEASGLL